MAEIQNSIEQLDMKAFYEMLNEMRGIQPLYGHIYSMLGDMQRKPVFSRDAGKVLYIYFSLLGDGNARIALDGATLWKRWSAKWCGLVQQAMECEQRPVWVNSPSEDFFGIIERGVKDILETGYSDIIEQRVSGQLTVDKTGYTNVEPVTRPFVVEKEKDGLSYLYAVRYFDAKCEIEKACGRVFSRSHAVTEEEKSKCKAYFGNILRKGSKIDLKDRQLEAIVKGQQDNMILTGGPGTGKTTVVCFLLWRLLSQHPKMLNWNIFLAAPSGKAADRMRESLLEDLKEIDVSLSEAEVYKKIHSLESSTLHRLMSYQPNNQSFLYYSGNPFPGNSIFVIDEASMIDIHLFAGFLSALPAGEDQFRLYILGDADQLPSVEAGAVLGSMLASKGDFVVELNESVRFEGKIKALADNIQKSGKGESVSYPLFDGLPEKLRWEDGSVQYYSLGEPGVRNKAELRKSKERHLKRLIASWCAQYYIQTGLIEKACAIHPERPAIEQLEDIEKLLRIAENARILAAERRGLCGVASLNQLVRKELGCLNGEPFFVGQLLMLTRNQMSLRLYNGDTGIVVGEPGSGRLYLLLKKATGEESSGNHESCDYVFYPLSLLPNDALETAFAMTIHKAQGSGYPNVMMFLPERVGHPLLNHQIVYTGVTRTKKGCLTIISTQDAFQAACETKIERDTGVEIDI